MRILVVDDEVLLVKGIKFNLENDGYEVDGAYDGREALVLFEKNKYDRCGRNQGRARQIRLRAGRKKRSRLSCARI